MSRILQFSLIDLGNKALRHLRDPHLRAVANLATRPKDPALLADLIHADCLTTGYRFRLPVVLLYREYLQRMMTAEEREEVNIFLSLKASKNNYSRSEEICELIRKLEI